MSLFDVDSCLPWVSAVLRIDSFLNVQAPPLVTEEVKVL